MRRYCFACDIGMKLPSRYESLRRVYRFTSELFLPLFNHKLFVLICFLVKLQQLQLLFVLLIPYTDHSSSTHPRQRENQARYCSYKYSARGGRDVSPINGDHLGNQIYFSLPFVSPYKWSTWLKIVFVVESPRSECSRKQVQKFRVHLRSLDKKKKSIFLSSGISLKTGQPRLRHGRCPNSTVCV